MHTALARQTMRTRTNTHTYMHTHTYTHTHTHTHTRARAHLHVVVVPAEVRVHPPLPQQWHEVPGGRGQMKRDDTEKDTRAAAAWQLVSVIASSHRDQWRAGGGHRSTVPDEHFRGAIARHGEDGPVPNHHAPRLLRALGRRERLVIGMVSQRWVTQWRRRFREKGRQ